MSFNLMVILFLSLFISCGEKSDDGDSYYYPDNYKSLVQELKSTDFNCADEKNCPDNIGLIYNNSDGSTTYPKIGRCTGFLIKENIVATNSHCIPDHVKENSMKVYCHDYIAIRFIGDSKKKVFKCEEMLDFSDDISGITPDYAFFKIKPTKIQPLDISQSGIKDNQSSYIAKVTPSEYSLGGTLEVEDCRVAIGSLLNLNGTNSFSNTGLVVDCGVIPGNSGSPIINQNGEAIGIAQSFFKRNVIANLEESFKRLKLDLPDEIIPHAHFTNFSCVESQNLLKANPSCENGSKLTFNMCFNANADEEEVRRADEEEEVVLKQWTQELPEIFLYNIVFNPGEAFYQADPICVKTKEQLSNYDDYVNKSGGLYNSAREEIRLSYEKELKDLYKFNVDRDFRLEYIAEILSGEKIKHNIILWGNGKEWSGESKLMRRSYSNNYLRNRKLLSLKTCSKEEITEGNKRLISISNKTITLDEFKKLNEKKKESIKCEK